MERERKSDWGLRVRRWTKSFDGKGVGVGCIGGIVVAAAAAAVGGVRGDGGERRWAR